MGALINRGENALQYACFLSQYVLCISEPVEWLKIYEHDKDDSLLKTLTKYTRRNDESKKKKKEKSKQDKPNKFVIIVINPKQETWKCWIPLYEITARGTTPRKTMVSLG